MTSTDPIPEAEDAAVHCSTCGFAHRAVAVGDEPPAAFTDALTTVSPAGTDE
jgi:hypothetical protein